MLTIDKVNDKRRIALAIELAYRADLVYAMIEAGQMGPAADELLDIEKILIPLFRLMLGRPPLPDS